MKSGALNYPEPLGPPRPVTGDLYFTYSPFLFGTLEDAVRAVSRISEVVSFENADLTSFLTSSSCVSCCCASHIGINKATLLTVFISTIHQWRFLKKFGNYSLRRRRLEIKTHNKWCLSASALACSTLLVKCLSAICKESRLLQSVLPMISPELFIGAAQASDQGSCGQTSLVTVTHQSVRFRRSLASPIHTHVFFRSSEWAGNARARWSLARGT